MGHSVWRPQKAKSGSQSAASSVWQGRLHGQILVTHDVHNMQTVEDTTPQQGEVLSKNQSRHDYDNVRRKDLGRSNVSFP